MSEFLISEPDLKNIKLVEVNYDQINPLFKEHRVDGVPTILVFVNNELRVRHLGEFTKKELKMILTNVF